MACARVWGAALTVAAAVAVTTCPAADAEFDDYALNGAFVATSNGEWAKTNEVFHDQDSVRSTWTISSTCSNPADCTGTASSDLGWTAPIYKTNGIWYLKHVVPNWIPCSDGTFVDGVQTFRFFPSTPEHSYQRVSDVFQGEDISLGPSGACGKNLQLEIRMPFKLVRA